MAMIIRRKLLLSGGALLSAATLPCGSVSQANDSTKKTAMRLARNCFDLLAMIRSGSFPLRSARIRS